MALSQEITRFIIELTTVLVGAGIGMGLGYLSSSNPGDRYVGGILGAVGGFGLSSLKTHLDHCWRAHPLLEQEQAQVPEESIEINPGPTIVLSPAPVCKQEHKPVLYEKKPPTPSYPFKNEFTLIRRPYA